MSTKVTDYLAEKLVWRKTTDPKYPFVADFDGERCVIRINDFPDETLYTLMVDDVEVANFDDWSAHWKRP